MSDDPTTLLGRPSSPAARARELTQGSTIGPWTIEGPLGGGGFGSVYEVSRAGSRELFALKILHAHFVTSAEMLARFEREVRILRHLQHPNIVALVDAGFSEDGRPYLCTELLDGEELGDLIERMGGLPPAMALSVFQPLCDAVAAAHELGIIHRDIKASNIIVCRPARGERLGRVVLLDFGIAKISDALAPELTASHQSLGTPSCMAPEQIHGLAVDARTDVYALGGLLFHMLTGRMAFQDSSATMTQYLHLHARRPRASSLSSVSQRLDDVIVRAMAIEPSARLPDPQSLLAAVRAAMRESAVHRAVAESDCGAILINVGDRSGGTVIDERLFDDLEAVLPTAERFLGNLGFILAVDLGSSALFVSASGSAEEHVASALAVWEKLERRRTLDPRVRVGLCVHRGVASIVGAEVQTGPLLRPATWNVPDELEGVWVTSAIDASAPDGKRIH